MIRVSIGNAAFEEGIRFPLHPEEPVSVSVRGHALFDKKGRDIVCAAVSVLSQTMALSLSRLGGISQDLQQGEDALTTRIDAGSLSDEQLRSMKIILDVFLIGIFEIIRNYPGHVEMEFSDSNLR